MSRQVGTSGFLFDFQFLAFVCGGMRGLEGICGRALGENLVNSAGRNGYLR